MAFKNLLFIALLMTLTACSQKTATVPVKLKIFKSNLATGVPLYGGIVLFGNSEDGLESFRMGIANANQDLSLDLKKGKWEFTAIGWSGEEGILTGQTRCASSGVVDLRDNEATVNFNLNHSRCLSSYGSAAHSFSQGAQYPNGDFHKLQPVLCVNGTLNSTACAPSLNSTIYKSYRAVFSSDKKGTLTNGLSELTSACQLVGASPVLTLPVGDNSGTSELGFRFIFYPTTTCTGTSLTENFKTSLKHGTTGSTLRALENNSGIATNYLFINPGAGAVSSSVQINAAAPYTASYSVDVSFANLPSDTTDLCFSELSTGSDCSGPNWITLLTSPRAITLSAGDGTKTVYVFSKNSSNVVSLVGEDSIVLDTSAPASNGAGSFQPTYNTVPVVLSWPAYTDATAVNYDVSFCDSAACSSGCTAVGNTTTPDITLTASPEGIFHVCIEAKDAANNTNAINHIGTFEYDTVAPVISSFVFDAGTGVTNSLFMNFSNAVSGGPVQMCFNSSSSPVGCAWNAYTSTGNYTLSAGEGLRDVYLHVKDQAGNTSFANTLITVDTMPPTLPGPATVNAFYNMSELPFSFNWGASTDANPVSHYDIKVCSNLDCSTGCGASRPTPGATPSDAIGIPEGLTEGQNHICLRAIDTFGNQSSYTQVASFYYDSIAPTLSGVSFLLANGDTYTKTRTVNWTRSGSVDATYMCISETANANVCAPWTPVTSSGTFQLADTQGAHNLYTFYKDNANNFSPPQNSSIVLDTVAPANMTFLSPNNIVETEEPEIAFSFTGGTDLNFQKIVARLCNDSACGVTYDTKELASGVYSGTLASPLWTMGTGAVVVLKSYDLAGNYSTVAVSFPLNRIYNLKPKEMSLGYFHSCFAFSNGQAKCFGENSSGQLGMGGTGNIAGTSPGQIAGLGFIDFQMAKVKSIVAGGYSTCALLSDGQLKCWGANAEGQLGIGSNALLTSPGAAADVGASPAIQVAVSETHTCIVTAAGDVKCWGKNLNGQLGLGNQITVGTTLASMGTNLLSVDLGSGKKAVKVSVGYGFSCALLSDRTVKCWGLNVTGQLGLDHTANIGDGPSEMGSNLPTVNLGTGVLDISSAQSHSCALLVTGVVKCWGSNIKGQLGTGTLTDHGAGGGSMAALTGVVFGGNKRAIKISTGTTTSCAVLEDGTSKCWGSNENGVIGQGNASPYFNDPSAINLNLGTNQTVRSIAVNNNNACAILGNGNVKCWGSASGHGQGVAYAIGNAVNQMGDELKYVNLGKTAILDTMKIASGYNHNCALMYNGLVKCWGSNTYGQLGSNTLGGFMGSMSTDMGANLKFLELGTGQSRFVRDISSGGFSSDHTCAQMVNGDMKCWGRNTAGQLGTGDNSGSFDNIGDEVGEVSASLPGIAFPSSQKIRSMSVGSYTSCAVTGNGSAYCFGENTVGQAGAESSASILLNPISPVILSEKIIQLTAGGQHTCALLETGEVKCWGSGSYGQLGDNRTINLGYGPSSMGSAVAVDMGSSAKTIKVDAGKNVTCALLDNRTVKCWGQNMNGVLGQDMNNNVGHASGNSVASTPIVNFMENSALSVAVDVETNGQTACVLRSNGSVRCWGDNADGMLGQNSATPYMGSGSYPTIAGNIIDSVLGFFAPAEKLTMGMNGCIISSHGEAMCWGSNYMGKAGQGTGASDYGTSGSPIPSMGIRL